MRISETIDTPVRVVDDIDGVQIADQHSYTILEVWNRRDAQSIVNSLNSFDEMYEMLIHIESLLLDRDICYDTRAGIKKMIKKARGES